LVELVETIDLDRLDHPVVPGNLDKLDHPVIDADRR
jgi:hypothetical protein